MHFVYKNNTVLIMQTRLLCCCAPGLCVAV